MASEKYDNPKQRDGMAGWIPGNAVPILRRLVLVEERSVATILSRAIHAYAMASPEYQKIVNRRDPK